VRAPGSASCEKWGKNIKWVSTEESRRERVMEKNTATGREKAVLNDLVQKSTGVCNQSKKKNTRGKKKKRVVRRSDRDSPRRTSWPQSAQAKLVVSKKTQWAEVS